MANWWNEYPQPGLPVPNAPDSGYGGPDADTAPDLASIYQKTFASALADYAPAAQAPASTLPVYRPAPASALPSPPVQTAKPAFDLSNTLSAAGTFLTQIPKSTLGAAAQAYVGGDRPDTYPQWARSVMEAANQQQVENQRLIEARRATGQSDSTSEALLEASPSSGFTAVSGLAGLGAFLGGSAVGSPLAGVGAAMGASGATGYRMAKAQFLDDAFKALEAKSQKEMGRTLTEEEKVKTYQDLEPIASNTALWEAGPEAIGNLALVAGGGTALGLLGKEAVKKIAANAASRFGARALAGATGLGMELATEGVTQYHQGNDQAKLEAYLTGASPDQAQPQYKGAEGLWQATKDVAPTVLALTAMMGVMAKGGHMAYQPIEQRMAARRAGEQAIETTNLNDAALSGIDAAQLEALANNGRQVLATNPRMPGRTREQLNAAIGALENDLQQRASGETLRGILAAPEQLATVRGVTALAGMADPARIGQLSDAEVLGAEQAARALMNNPVPGQEWIGEQMAEVADAYRAAASARNQMANLDEAIWASPEVAGKIADDIASVVTGETRKGITPEYARASLDDQVLNRRLQAGERLLANHADKLSPQQQAAVNKGLEALRGEREFRDANPDWREQNARILQANDPTEVRFRQAFAKNPAKAIAKLGKDQLPLIDSLISGLETRIGNFQRAGTNPPEGLASSLTLLRQRRDAVTGRAALQNEVAALNQQSITADRQRLHDLAQSADFANRQRTLLEQEAASRASQQEKFELARLLGPRKTLPPIPQPQVSATAPQSLADLLGQPARIGIPSSTSTLQPGAPINAQQVPEAGTPYGGRRPQPPIRQEGGYPPGSGPGIQPGGQGRQVTQPRDEGQGQGQISRAPAPAETLAPSPPQPPVELPPGLGSAGGGGTRGKGTEERQPGEVTPTAQQRIAANKARDTIKKIRSLAAQQQAKPVAARERALLARLTDMHQHARTLGITGLPTVTNATPEEYLEVAGAAEKALPTAASTKPQPKPKPEGKAKAASVEGKEPKEKPTPSTAELTKKAIADVRTKATDELQKRISTRKAPLENATTALRELAGRLGIAAPDIGPGYDPAQHLAVAEAVDRALATHLAEGDRRRADRTKAKARQNERIDLANPTEYAPWESSTEALQAIAPDQVTEKHWVKVRSELRRRADQEDTEKTRTADAKTHRQAVADASKAGRAFAPAPEPAFLDGVPARSAETKADKGTLAKYKKTLWTDKVRKALLSIFDPIGDRIEVLPRRPVGDEPDNAIIDVPDIKRGRIVRAVLDGIESWVSPPFGAIKNFFAFPVADIAGSTDPNTKSVVAIQGDKVRAVQGISDLIDQTFPDLDAKTDAYFEPFFGAGLYLNNLRVLQETSKPIHIYSAEAYEPQLAAFYRRIKAGDDALVKSLQTALDTKKKATDPLAEWVRQGLLKKPARIEQAKTSLPNFVAALRKPNVYLHFGDADTAFAEIRRLAKTGQRITLLDDSNYATLPHEDPQNQYHNPDGANPMDPQYQLDSKRALYHDVLKSGGHIVGTNHPSPVLFAGIVNDPTLGAKTRMYGFENFAQWSPDIDAAVHKGEGAKSNFISLHRVEYLALIGPEVENGNVRELEGREDSERGSRGAVVSHRPRVSNAGKGRNLASGTGSRAGQPAVGSGARRRVQGDGLENRPEGRPDSDAGRDRVAGEEPPTKFARATARAEPTFSVAKEGDRWVARAPDGSELYSGANRDWVELRGAQEFQQWRDRQASSLEKYANQPKVTGYRGVMPEGSFSFGATEGNGIYLGKTPNDANFFSENGKTTKHSYRKPLNPLVVEEEPLYILQEDDEIMRPIAKGDSEWTRLNKQARINTGATDENWGQKQQEVEAELTRLMLEAGYDAVDVTSGGQKWVVLIDPALIEASGFSKPTKYAGARASTPAAVRDALSAIAGNETVQGLIDNDRLTLVGRQSQLPADIRIPPGERAAGVVHPTTGRVYLVAENIAPGEIEGFLLHETGVHQERLGLDAPRTRLMNLARAMVGLVGGRQLLGENTFNDVLKQVAQLHRGGHKAVKAAYAEADAAMAALGQDVGNMALRQEERLAYLVGNPANYNLPVVRRILAAVRAFLYRAGIKLNLTVDDLAMLAQTALRQAARRDGAGMGSITAGTFGGETGAQLAQRFKDTGFISNNDVLAILGDYPEYLNAVADYILSQHKKLVEGKVTPRDVAKAYLLTLASQRSDAIKSATIQRKTGFVVPERFLDQNGLVRPEEAMAAWLLSPEGKRALDSIETGVVDMDLWEPGLQVRDAFGANILRNAFLERQYPGAVKGEPRMLNREGDNLRELLAVTDRINAAKGDSAKLAAVLSGLTNIAGGKTGFIKHFLGLGDTPTVDVVELNTWLTGKGDIFGLKTKAAEAAREFAAKSDRPALTRAMVDRITMRFNQLRNQINIPSQYRDSRVYQHLMHHWLWDRAKGIETTHAGLYEAMLKAAQNREDTEARRQYDAVVAQYTNPDGSKKAGWMKAPNGQPTKLNERQWVQTRTPAFKAWFGDFENDPANASKVVDENGEPMLLYHATDKEFNEFKIGLDIGIHAGSLSQADQRALDVAEREELRGGEYLSGTRVIPIFFNIKNTLLVSDIGEFGDAIRLWANHSIRSAIDSSNSETYKKIDNLVDGLDKIKYNFYGPLGFRQSNDNKNVVALIRNGLEAAGYDGLTYQNSIEGTIGERTAYVALSPTQIKSAISNTGAFSPANPDIRYAAALGASDAALTADQLLAKVQAGEIGELTPDQWAQVQRAFLGEAATRTPKFGVEAPSFQTWFGDSKIKTKAGVPLKMYHATDAAFTAFDTAKSGQATTHPTAALGFFFTNDRDHAAAKYGSNVMEVYLAIEKPYAMKDADLRKIEGMDDARTFRAKLEQQGYDGIIMPAEAGKTRYVAAFKADQIKFTENATYTRGESDMRFARTAPPAAASTFDWQRNYDGSFRVDRLESDSEIARSRNIYSGWATFSKDGELIKTGTDWMTKPSRASLDKAQIEVNSLVDIWKTPLENFYFRFGDLPKAGKSKHAISGKLEKGISAYTAVPDVWGNYALDDNIKFPFFGMALLNRPAYEVSGRVIGYGSDGEPLLKDAKVVRKIETKEIKRLMRIKENSGNSNLSTNADTRFARASPIQQVVQDRAKGALGAVKGFVQRLENPLHGMADLKPYMVQRYLALGKIGEAEKETRQLYDLFRAASEADAKAIYDYLTTPAGDPATISDAKLRTAAVRTKARIDQLGRGAVARGLISQVAYDKYKDAYLPRLYLRHLLDTDSVVKMLSNSGKKPDLGWTKQRKDIPEPIRRLVLGEIKDPAFLVSKGIGTELRDMALIDWFEQIAQNKNWVLPESLVDWNGRKVTPYWLASEARQIRAQVPYYNAADAKAAAALADRMDATANKALAGMPDLPEGWRKLPDASRYGLLRGMVVRKEIHGDIVGTTSITTDDNIAQAILGDNGMLARWTSLWKWSKVAANPPAQIRNFISNGVLLHLSGVPFHRVPQRMIQAAREIKTKGRYYQIGMKYGLTESSFTNQELRRIDTDFIDLLARQSGNGWARVKALGAHLYERTSDLYQLSETLFKTAKIIDAMERQGMTEADAAMEAQRALFDYSLVSPSVRYLRNAPLGMPFVTFQTKVLPALARTARHHPLRFAPYVAIPYILTAWLAGQEDVDDDDVKALQQVLPKWLREKGHAWFLPMRDGQGRLVAMDFGYFLPWTGWEEIARKAITGHPIEALQALGMMGSPVIDLATAAQTNKDPFTQKDIVNKYDPPATQMASIMNYLWRLAMPTFITDIGVLGPDFVSLVEGRTPLAGKLAEATTAKIDRYGQPKTTTPQAIARLAGINLYPVNPAISRADNLKRMEYELRQEQARMTVRLKDLNLTPEERRNLAQLYARDLQERAREMREYAEASKVNPKLNPKPATGLQ